MLHGGDDDDDVWEWSNENDSLYDDNTHIIVCMSLSM